MLRVRGVRAAGVVESVVADEVTVTYLSDDGPRSSVRDVPMTRHKRLLLPGASVSVLYDPNRPHYFVFDEVEGRPGVVLNALLIAVFVATGVTFLRRR